MASFLHCLASLTWVLVILLSHVSAFPLCVDMSAPINLTTQLAFCSYNGSACCDATADSTLQKQFQSMNISDPTCASLVKATVCAKCDPFAADLFTRSPEAQSVPALCNSSSKSSIVSFCNQFWDACKETTMLNSPFSMSKGSTEPASKLVDLWPSKEDFCRHFGGSSANGSACFNGKTALANDTENPPFPKGLCFERIDNGSYLNMAAHPDGLSRVFLSSQTGKIWLATIPELGSGKMLEIDTSNPFLDLSDVVHVDSEFGLMGIAFHPKFMTNGRFFVSYNCDKSKTTGCAGKCSCNSEVGCDPSKLVMDNAGGSSQPCQYHSVIAEFAAEGSPATSMASSANPSEARRIFTMGLPFTSHHGGQILFGPKDGYLYFMMGDGGGDGDPINLAQNKKSLLGKIMRFDVDNVPSAKLISDLGLWGNYSIPPDNPYRGDNMSRPEIWALGFRNPWRCSFDANRPSYFICADVGQDVYEEVDLISKGGNYGWRVYEGPYPFNTSNAAISSLNTILPVMGYNHSQYVDTNAKSASITGGYVYRSETDPCMVGRYLFADLYSKYMWVGTENPANSGKYNSTLISFNCASDTPIPCEYIADGSPYLRYVFSFGQDNNKDVYILANNGLYRVVPPSRCNYTCPIEKPNYTSPAGLPTPSSCSQLKFSRFVSKLSLSFFLSAAILSL